MSDSKAGAVRCFVVAWVARGFLMLATLLCKGLNRLAGKSCCRSRSDMLFCPSGPTSLLGLKARPGRV